MLTIRNKLLDIENRLSTAPDGFDLDDYYMCVICSKVVGPGAGWYDKLGPKCSLCQKAIVDEIIPSVACLDRTSWLAMWEINQLGYHHRVIRMMMKNQQLKPRLIKDNSGIVYFYVFMIKENPALKGSSKRQSSHKLLPKS